MARDFRPKEKKSKPSAASNGHARTEAAPRNSSSQGSRYASAPRVSQSQNGKGQHKSFDAPEDTKASQGTAEDGDEEGNEDELREAIAALGGSADDFDLISSAALKGKGKQNGPADEASLGSDLRAFMKGLNFDTSDAPPLAAQVPENAGKSAEKKEKQKESKPATDTALEAEAQADGSKDAMKSKKEKKREMAAAAQKEKEAAAARRERDAKLETIAVKTAAPAAAKVASKADANIAASARKSSGDLLLEPSPQWMESALEPLPSTSSSASSSSSNVTHEQALRLLARGNELLQQDNDTYHSLLNSGSASKMQSLGGLTPSDARYISSLLGDGHSASGTGKSGGTLSDRIAAHALLLGSSPLHNLRSLDALLTMAGKKSREESGRATRALADWFSGAGLGSRKLRYIRDQPEAVITAEMPESRAKNQRLAFFAFEDGLKKTYFNFLQTLENQGHDPLTFVRQQAVTQVYLLLKEKSEQEQNLLRLLVNKLGDGERSVASKAMNHLLELLNVHSAMKAIVAREVTDLIRRPTQSTSRSENENTKKHHNHAKYYGVLTLNQVMLTRGDVDLANTLIQLYFELFEQSLADEQLKGDGEENANEEEGQKKKKDRWRDKKGGKKGGKGKKNNDQPKQPSIVQDTEGKMMAAILTGVRRAFPFANVEVNVFDKYLNTLFRITHSASFNIAIQALQLIQVLATSSNTSSVTLLDRFHSVLYSSLLDPRLATTSKTAMYLNLCFKAMRDDVDEERRAAEVKRLIQILGQMDAEFVCGALFLVGELFRAHPRLRGMLNDPEDDDEEIIVQPPDEEDEDEADKTSSNPTAATALTSSTSYDATKRDPRYAHAKGTCLWDLIPLLHHFHPTVKLLSKQLLQSESLTTTPDLTLYSLSHFLDRFVYRNAKKSPSLQKGVSGMQPAISGNTIEDGSVRKIKGWQGDKNDEVNTEKFWKKKVQDVPVDALFFHHYFNLKEGRSGGKKDAKSRGDEGDDSDDGEEGASDDESLASDEVDDALKGEGDEDASDADSDSDDPEEKEIWAAMKRTMPSEGGPDGDLVDDEDDDEDEDEDLEQFNYSDSDEDEDDSGKIKDSDVSEGEEDESGMFDDDEDDLLPFADFDDDSESDSEEKTKKRSRDDEDEEEVEEKSENSKRNAARRQEKKKRKAAPTFASADDYAHLLGDD
ncbi:unnamed protein product [Sympodiomycopsis kandeliae]